MVSTRSFRSARGSNDVARYAAVVRPSPVPLAGVVLAAAAVLPACQPGSPSPAAPAPSAVVAPIASPPDSTGSSPCVSVIADHQRRVTAHLDAARAKTSARDGAGCLVELDGYDRDAWDPGPSTSPASSMAMSRGICMMLAGDCTKGKDLYRAAMASNAGATFGPEMLDRSVDAIGGLYCQGPALEPRDALLKAVADLNRGAYMSASTPAECQGAIGDVRRLLPVVKPRSPDDSQVTQAGAMLRVAGPECLARAGDCEAAWHVFHDAWLAEKHFDEATLRTMFGNLVRRCSDP